MPNFHSLQILPPANWQDFETLCCDLWGKIWNDPNTQKNGRQGQSQHGVDICGRPNEGKSWAGVQCKGKDNYADKSLAEKEVKSEVEKAKFFEPKLLQFIIATTGQKDAKIEELARKITEEHQKNGLFSVHIWGWNDVRDCLARFPEVIEIHYPGFSPNTKAVKNGIDEIKKMTQAILDQQTDLKSGVACLSKTIATGAITNYADSSTTILTPEYQAELDDLRDLLNNHNPKQALDRLEKLKNRIWPNANPIVKYRLLTNMGVAKLALNQEQEAAKLFLEALQYNPEDEKALGNTALGYLLLGQLEEAKTFANKVIAKNPASSHAYSIIIQISSDDEKLDDIIAKVPESYRTTPEVAYVIGVLAQNKRNFDEAKKWLEIAIENDTANLPDPKGELGSTLITLVRASVDYVNQIDETKKGEIEKAVQLLTDAWNCIANTDLRNFKSTWIAHRGVARELLGDLKGAIEDTEAALRIDPSNPIFIQNRAGLAYRTDDDEKAITLFREILSAKETPEVSLRLAEVLHKKNKSSEAINIINEFLESNPSEPLKGKANRLLIQLYIDTKELENARKISDSMRVSDPANILNLVDAARISKFSGESTNAIALLKEAKEYINNSSSFEELSSLADELYFLEQFEDAASIYEKFVDKTLDNQVTRKLLNSYYRAGEISKALDICQILRKKYGLLEHVSEMESAIYEEIGNLPEAKRICHEYLESFPDDIGMKLRLAVVSYRSNDVEELNKFLNYPIDINDLSLEHGLQIAYLYANRKMVKKSFEIMYELRRKFSNNADAHLKYIGCFLQGERDAEEWLSISKIGIDSAICIQNDSDQQKWYIIENRKDADIHRKEVNLEHPLTQELLGKSVGDKCLLKESYLSKEVGEVVEIKSKYVYAFQETLSSFETWFPGVPGLWGIKVGSPKKKGDLPNGIQTSLDEISRQHVITQQVEQFYRKGKLTIGTFANLIGRDILNVWGGMVNKPDIGVRCCLGNTDERNQAISLLNNKPKLIIDIISLMTLCGINTGDIIIKAFGKLGIAQSTIDFIQDTINERKGIQSKGFMTIGKEGDEFVRQEISSADILCSIEYLESILDWIKNNCDIIPCNTALNIRRDRKQYLDKMFGSSFVDTVLIASETGNILYSDDEQLRSFAKTEFNVDGVWTQIVLMYCLNINLLEKAKYTEGIVKLVCSHYYHTSIDADVLIEAARQSKWEPSQPYLTVLQVLNGESSDEVSALIVGTNFLYELWRQPILAHKRDYLILKLLDALTAERNRKVILDKLASNVKKRFTLLPLTEREILSLIKIWEQMHIT